MSDLRIRGKMSNVSWRCESNGSILEKVDSSVVKWLDHVQRGSNGRLVRKT